MFDDPALDRDVTKAFRCYLTWYMWTRADTHTEASLQSLSRAAQDLLASLKVFRLVTGPLSEVHNRL
jgi:type VI protein secretion system component VasK